MSGPIGRRGRWHHFLAKFQLDIIYVKGEGQTVPGVMSRWVYPVAHAAPDVSIMGSQADVEGWEADDREERSWADSQVAREIPPHFVRAYGAWYRQFAGVCPARERVCLSSVVSDFPSVRRIYEEEQSSGEIHQSPVQNCNTGFLFTHAPTVVRNGSSGPCTKIMMSRTGRTRVWSLRTLVFQIHCGHPQSL